MNKQRHDVGYREFRPRARIDQRANALARHQRYDSWRIRSFARVLQYRSAVLGVRCVQLPAGYPGAGVARKTQRRT
jgi:hypothetical protein